MTQMCVSNEEGLRRGGVPGKGLLARYSFMLLMVSETPAKVGSLRKPPSPTQAGTKLRIPTWVGPCGSDFSRGRYQILKMNHNKTRLSYAYEFLVGAHFFSNLRIRMKYVIIFPLSKKNVLSLSTTAFRSTLISHDSHVTTSCCGFDPSH